MQTSTNFYDWARFVDCLNPGIESRDTAIGVSNPEIPGLQPLAAS